ncbi:MAG: Crp/Fnr family transcriptional regulator [Deltaproteobacteria bacterium]
MSTDTIFDPYVVEVRTYKEGDVIIEEGSFGSWVFVIQEGSVKVKKTTAKRLVTIDTLKEGEVFGEMVFLEGGTGARSASVIAAETPVKVGLLDTQKLIDDYEAVAPEVRTLILSLMIKLRETTSKVCSIIVAR